MKALFLRVFLSCVALAGSATANGLPGGAQAWASCPVEKSSLWRNPRGTLHFFNEAIEFQPEGGGPALVLDYQEIQQLKWTPDHVQVTTYEDRSWLLGLDRSHRFTFAGPCLDVDHVLKLRRKVGGVFVDGSDRRSPEGIRYSTPVKLRRILGGDHGVLEIGPDEIAFRTSSKSQSRVWTYDQIQSFWLPSDGELELFTAELKFGGPTRTFRFQLKRPLPDSLYDYLWVRVHRAGAESRSAEGEGRP